MTVKTKRVLIAEDDPGVADFLQESVTQAGYEVLMARDGEQAIQLIQQHSDIDALITDHEMPKASGMQVLQKFHEKYPQSPVCVFTSNPDTEVVMGLMDSAFDIAVFLKPTRIEPILSWLKGEKLPSRRVF